MLIAALLKVRWNHLSTYLIAGGDGPYYPLQVRSIMENLHLAFPDMPLLFLLDAAIAKALSIFQIASPDNCVLFAIVFTNIVLPPLAAIPVFLLVKEMKPEEKKILFPQYLIVAFAVLNFTTLILFPNSQLNKNAVAMIGVFFFLYYLIRILKHGLRKDFVWAAITLVACALTHFGSFSILLLVTFLVAAIHFLSNQNRFHFKQLKIILLFLTAVLIMLALIATLDFERFLRLIKIPLKVFEAPLLLFLLHDENPYMNPLAILTMVPANILAIIGLIVLLKNRRQLHSVNKTIGFTMVILTFFFSSPLLGIEWASRLFMMSYVPLAILYIITFNIVKSKLMRVIPLVLFTLMIFIYLFMGITFPTGQVITDEAFTEFKTLDDAVDFNSETLIAGRQDIRLLNSWFYRTKSSADYLLSQKDFYTYKAIYVVKQIKGSNLPSGRFRETTIPAGAIKKIGGEYFEVYQLANSDGWNFANGNFIVARGLITSVENNSIVIHNTKTNYTRTVCLTKNTQIHFMQNENQLANGIYVEVSGSRKPFSLAVDGDVIQVTKIPD
ncbi:MAG: hypothetical protein LH473_11895 [Chitinophagales bacterium]|nr:hypothetical protein [Chitinophagales bacterium]